ncbi:SRPBCC domain-containing protein [Streptomyces althioticus]|uniref:SRPBCC family protein n=1 Tax=Streptomyces althioticus TaxID=83380 RepID=UPI003872A933|nr:SRPBCC domain-containing protein [Streptomyces althioticus]
MEHEVFVPVEAQRLREVLGDPARVARAVPGLQHDAGAEPVTGRLKVRIGGSSITYRGSVRVSARDDGGYAVEGEASESRGDGTVRLSLRLTPRPADTGTTLVVTGTATADGRVKDLPQDAVTSAVTRLLTRFAENLATATKEDTAPPESEDAAPPESEDAAPPESPEQLAAGDAEAAPPESPEQLAAGDFEPGVTTDFETTPDAEDAPPPPPERGSGAAPDEPTGPPVPPGPSAEGGPAANTPPAPEGASGPGAEPAPNALPGPEGNASPDAPPAPEGASGPGAEPGSDAVSAPDAVPGPEGKSAPDAVPGQGIEPGSEPAPEPDAPDAPDAGAVPATPEPLDAEFTGGIDGRPLPGDDDDDSLAEAAHARRTMIGRSAEEVDHAPPRGRYAPVPAPQTVSSSAPLRWAAPAAALAVASAVVAIRALRRRR